ncbi:MAG: FliM/FliN family flagellar motor switch protein, partial [Gammaproteobacteria bacterium]|nr:FliM/FliN family flagellar motor switch protein [Gammaproteobacteria bacterium]
ISPQLVCAVVENFFGGKGRLATIENRDFTATETRIIQMLLQAALTDLRDAWSAVLDIRIEQLGTETNPQFATFASPTEIVVISCFAIDIEGAGGELHVTVPYAALAPLRDILDSGVHGERSQQQAQWTQALREEIEDCDVTLTTVFGQGRMTLGDLINLKPGDIVPCDFSGKVTVYAEDVPIIRGSFGVSRNQMAVQVTERLIRGKTPAITRGHP